MKQYFYCPYDSSLEARKESLKSTCALLQDRDKGIARLHLGDTIEELKKFNARRKLKAAVKLAVSSPRWHSLCSEANGDSYYELGDEEVMTTGMH